MSLFDRYWIGGDYTVLFRQSAFDEVPNLITTHLGFCAADKKRGQFVPEF
jgi:hypothetical protein